MTDNQQFLETLDRSPGLFTQFGALFRGPMGRLTLWVYAMAILTFALIFTPVMLPASPIYAMRLAPMRSAAPPMRGRSNSCDRVDPETRGRTGRPNPY